MTEVKLGMFPITAIDCRGHLSNPLLLVMFPVESRPVRKAGGWR